MDVAYHILPCQYLRQIVVAQSPSANRLIFVFTSLKGLGQRWSTKLCLSLNFITGSGENQGQYCCPGESHQTLSPSGDTHKLSITYRLTLFPVKIPEILNPLYVFCLFDAHITAVTYEPRDRTYFTHTYTLTQLEALIQNTSPLWILTLLSGDVTTAQCLTVWVKELAAADQQHNWHKLHFFRKDAKIKL